MGPRALRRLAYVLVLAAAAACGGEAGEVPAAQEAERAAPAEAAEADRPAVLAAAQAVLDAINRSDPALLREVMMPDASVVGVSPGGVSGASSVEAMAALVEDPPQRFVERMWDPEIRIDGPIASVWAPYDFYADGELSHCGVDAFHLVRVDGAWRVQSVVYNRLQPPECELHPDGPPAP